MWTLCSKPQFLRFFYFAFLFISQAGIFARKRDGLICSPPSLHHGFLWGEKDPLPLFSFSSSVLSPSLFGECGLKAIFCGVWPGPPSSIGPHGTEDGQNGSTMKSKLNNHNKKIYFLKLLIKWPRLIDKNLLNYVCVPFEQDAPKISNFCPSRVIHLWTVPFRGLWVLLF